MKKKIKWIVLAVLIIGVLGAMLGGGDDSSDSDKETKEKTEQVEEVSEPYTVQLTSGNYTAGIDIPIGKYNITAISGKGNVSSSNLYNGGINAMMGIDDGSGLYEATFNNLDLSKDVILTISGGVTIELNSDSAKTKSLKTRKVQGEECILNSGNYTAGNDFVEGVYNISIVSGNGNVSSSNLYDGGINAIMGTDGDIYEKEYKNIKLPKNATLEVSGCQIKLTPSN